MPLKEGKPLAIMATDGYWFLEELSLGQQKGVFTFLDEVISFDFGRKIELYKSFFKIFNNLVNHRLLPKEVPAAEMEYYCCRPTLVPKKVGWFSEKNRNLEPVRYCCYDGSKSGHRLKIRSPVLPRILGVVEKEEWREIRDLEINPQRLATVEPRHPRSPQQQLWSI